MKKDVREYIDNMTKEELEDYLCRSEALDIYLKNNYTGSTPIVRNYEIPNYMRYLLDNKF